MGPIIPPDTLPVAVRITGDLSPERTIFIDAGVQNNAKWFDITLQCGPSLKEEDDIAFRVIVNFNKNYSAFTTNSCMAGVWDDALARKKELKIKGLIQKTEDIDDKSLYNLSNLSNLLRCALRPQTRTNLVESTHTFKEALKADEEKDDLFRRTSEISKMAGMSKVKIIDSYEDINESSQKLSKKGKSHHFKTFDENKSDSSRLSSENNKNTTSGMKMTEGPDEKTPKNDTFKSTVRIRPDQNDEIKPDKQIRTRDEQEQVKRQVNENLSKKPLENISPKSEEFRDILTENPFKPVASEYINPDLKAVRFYSNIDMKLEENLGKLNLLDKISMADQPVLDESFSEAEMNEIDLHPGEPFSMALECLENGYLMFLNGELFCVYPHHFDYNQVSYIVFNGNIDLELVEVGGGKGPDRTLVVDLYDQILWSDQVVVLTDANFYELVLGSQEMWIVDAYTAWCPACEQLRPAWQTAAIELMGKIKVGACDCERNEQVTDDLDVKYFPMIMCFPEGKKDVKHYQKYCGSYIANHIVLWALNQLEYGRLPKPIQTTRPALKEVHKSGPRTLRKKKKSIRERRGYLVSGYGYILRKEEERPEYHETSSTKFIYASTQTEIDLEREIVEEGEENPDLIKV